MGEIFFDVLGPVVLIVVAGGVAGRKLGIAPEPLAKLAYWILGPAFLFDALTKAVLAPDVVGQMTLALVAGMAVAGGSAWVLAGGGRGQRAVAATGAAYGNVGNFGLAVSVFAFGDEARAPAAVALVVVNTLGVLIGVGLGQHPGTGAAAAIRRAVTTPMTLAVAAAIVVSSTDAPIPLVIERPIGLVANALIPTMLLTLGAQLQRMGRPAIDRVVAGTVTAKLVVKPAVAAGVAAVLGLGGVAGSVVAVQAAMPTAVFTTVIALELGTDPADATTIVWVGTVAAMLTLPVVLAITM